jgi:hypothetical protein
MHCKSPRSPTRSIVSERAASGAVPVNPEMCPVRPAVILSTWPTTLAEPKPGSGNSAPHGLGAPRVPKFGLPKIDGLRIRGGAKKELRSITPPERHRPLDLAFPLRQSVRAFCLSDNR